MVMRMHGDRRGVIIINAPPRTGFSRRATGCAAVRFGCGVGAWACVLRRVRRTRCQTFSRLWSIAAVAVGRAE